MLSVMQYMKENDVKVGGRFGYGSELWLYRPELATKIMRMVADNFQSRTGKPLNIAMPGIKHEFLLDTWVTTRKNKTAYKRLRDGHSLVVDAPGHLYAYLAVIPRYSMSKRCLKLGWTGQKDLDKYIRGKSRVLPIKMAWRSGTRAEEDMIKNRWLCNLVDGAEFYRFTSEMADWLECEWFTVPDFQTLRSEHCEL